MASGFVEKIESAEQQDTSTGAGLVASDPATTTSTNTATPTDILLIGRTGMGKSSTGNKLLQVLGHEPNEWFDTTPEPTKDSVTTNPVPAKPVTAKSLPVPTKPVIENPNPAKFVTTNSSATNPVHTNSVPTKSAPAKHGSVTRNCKLLTNDIASLRIVDVPGFAPSDALSRGLTSRQANLRIMREILMIQEKYDLRFHRIIYFFPARGELPRADATFMEELDVMHYFFGDAIFQNMIPVATARPKKSKKNELDADDLGEFKSTYHSAYQEIVKKDATPQRPVIYISLEDTPEDILQALMTQSVGLCDGIQLKISEDVCAKCAIKLLIQDVHGTKTCTFACYRESARIRHEDTRCHPDFVRKWTLAERGLGGTLCILTVGIAHLAGTPWFTDATEICFNCGNIPGTRGCTKVKTAIKLNGTIVNHTSEVECYDEGVRTRT